jgi:hypothetical protein
VPQKAVKPVIALRQKMFSTVNKMKATIIARKVGTFLINK